MYRVNTPLLTNTDIIQGVLKDLDFKRKLNLTEDMKEKFLTQIDNDSKVSIQQVRRIESNTSEILHSS